MFTTNRSFWTNRLASLPKVAASNETTTVRRYTTTAPRLSPQQIIELVKAYENGQTVYALADQFGIHRTTVSAHLHRQGTPLRRQALTSDDITHAQRLYAGGWSLARIGDRLNADAHTIRRALKTRGVRMRDTHGREQ
jgi:DNA-binding CsgD family transcriptional regulator